MGEMWLMTVNHFHEAIFFSDPKTSSLEESSYFNRE